jgi:hypothetical protein
LTHALPCNGVVHGGRAVAMTTLEYIVLAILIAGLVVCVVIAVRGKQ